MRDYVTKVDNAAPSPAGLLTADEDNVRFEELKQAVATAGISLDPIGGPNSAVNMLAQAMARYASGGVFGQDGGAVNAYVIAATSAFIVPKALFKGMRVQFYAGQTNNGPSTLNAFALGNKALYDHMGAALEGGEIIQYRLIEAIYDPVLGAGQGAWKLAPWANALLYAEGEGGGEGGGGEGPGVTAGGLVNVQLITATGTYTKTTGTSRALVFATAGGGGGGGRDRGGGGGAGATAIALVDLSSTSTVACTIGAAGSAGVNSFGGDGGSTSFGTYAIAGGGKGGGIDGVYGGGNSNGAGGPGGTASAGLLQLGGQAGTSAGPIDGGTGGSSFWGGGGRPGDHNNFGPNGGAPNCYGAGGGGGDGLGNGATGTAGAIFVIEFA